MRKELFVLLLSGARMSTNERSSLKSVCKSGGRVSESRVKINESMVVGFVKAAIGIACRWRGGLELTFKIVSI